MIQVSTRNHDIHVQYLYDMLGKGIRVWDFLIQNFHNFFVNLDPEIWITFLQELKIKNCFIFQFSRSKTTCTGWATSTPSSTPFEPSGTRRATTKSIDKVPASTSHTGKNQKSSSRSCSSTSSCTRTRRSCSCSSCWELCVDASLQISSSWKIFWRRKFARRTRLSGRGRPSSSLSGSGRLRTRVYLKIWRLKFCRWAIKFILIKNIFATNWSTGNWQPCQVVDELLYVLRSKLFIFIQKWCFLPVSVII